MSSIENACAIFGLQLGRECLRNRWFTVRNGKRYLLLFSVFPPDFRVYGNREFDMKFIFYVYGFYSLLLYVVVK